MPYPRGEIERERLREIFKHLRIVGGNIVPIPYRSDLNALTAAGVPVDGFQVDQAAEYHARAEAATCTRCGKYPPRIDRKTCARCADDLARNSRRHRDKKRGGPPTVKVSTEGAKRRAAARWRKRKQAGRAG